MSCNINLTSEQRKRIKSIARRFQRYFRVSEWRWNGKVPDESEIETTILQLIEMLRNQSNECQSECFVSTGGIEVSMIESIEGCRLVVAFKDDFILT